MARVYIIATGERGEGQTPLSAHRTLADAKAAVSVMLPTPMRRIGPYRWCVVEPNGVDEIWIYSLDLPRSAS